MTQQEEDEQVRNPFERDTHHSYATQQAAYLRAVTLRVYPVRQQCLAIALQPRHKLKLHCSQVEDCSW